MLYQQPYSAAVWSPLSCPVPAVLQMHKGLDIAISDEASSTVIHVRGPVSARMCDVGGVFDKLGKCCFCTAASPAAPILSVDFHLF